MRRFCVTSLFILVALAAPAAAADIEAWAARILPDPAGERLEIDLTARVGFRTFALTDPMRLVIDLPPVVWRIGAPPSGPTALTRNVRFGVAESGGGRVVIDLDRPVRVAAAHTEPIASGGRLVIALAPESLDSFAVSAGWPAELSRRGRQAPDLGPPTPRPRPRRGVLVAIDAGHGGRDAGATHDGLLEKDLVFDYALGLAEALEARPGFAAYLVRDGDEFLRLRERVRRARLAGAHLMISLHADALESGVASGASVYTLSEDASDAEAEELVHSHNRADAIDGAPMDDVEDDVATVLVDLARRRTDRESVELAEILVEELKTHATVLEGRALQSAGFRVLKAPDMPSVLVELGFLSAPGDRARLLSEEGRAALITALAESVFRWAAQRNRAPSAEMQAKSP